MRSAHPQTHTQLLPSPPDVRCCVYCTRAHTTHALSSYIYTYIAFLPFTAGTESYYSSSSSSSSCGNMSSVCDDREGHGLEAARDTPFLIRSRCKPERGIARFCATARKSSSLSLSFGFPLFIYFFFFTLECALSIARERSFKKHRSISICTSVSFATRRYAQS